MNFIFAPQRGGYIALMSAIVISLLLLAITFTLSFTNFFARFNVLNSEYKERSSGLAEACVDTALWRLASDPSYAGNETSTIGADACHIFLVTSLSGTLTVKSQAVFGNSYTNIVAVISSTGTVVSWVETSTLP